MKLVKAVQCAGVFDSGPFKGQRCTERRNLVKCSNILMDGCDNYYCLFMHWHEHWDVHVERVFSDGDLSANRNEPRNQPEKTRGTQA